MKRLLIIIFALGFLAGCGDTINFDKHKINSFARKKWGKDYSDVQRVKNPFLKKSKIFKLSMLIPGDCRRVLVPGNSEVVLPLNSELLNNCITAENIRINQKNIRNYIKFIVDNMANPEASSSMFLNRKEAMKSPALERLVIKEDGHIKQVGDKFECVFYTIAFQFRGAYLHTVTKWNITVAETGLFVIH